MLRRVEKGAESTFRNFVKWLKKFKLFCKLHKFMFAEICARSEAPHENDPNFSGLDRKFERNIERAALVEKEMLSSLELFSLEAKNCAKKIVDNDRLESDVQLRLRHALKVLIDTYLFPNVEMVAEAIKTEMLDLPAIFLRKDIEQLVGAIQELQEELVQIDEHTKKENGKGVALPASDLATMLYTRCCGREFESGRTAIKANEREIERRKEAIREKSEKDERLFGGNTKEEVVAEVRAGQRDALDRFFEEKIFMRDVEAERDNHVVGHGRFAAENAVALRPQQFESFTTTPTALPDLRSTEVRQLMAIITDIDTACRLAALAFEKRAVARQREMDSMPCPFEAAVAIMRNLRADHQVSDSVRVGNTAPLAVAAAARSEVQVSRDRGGRDEDRSRSPSLNRGSEGAGGRGQGCFEWAKLGSCKFGETCRFVHEGLLVGEKQSGGGSGGTRGAESGLRSRRDESCVAFEHGQCQMGLRCQFKHPESRGRSSSRERSAKRDSRLRSSSPSSSAYGPAGGARGGGGGERR